MVVGRPRGNSGGCDSRGTTEGMCVQREREGVYHDMIGRKKRRVEYDTIPRRGQDIGANWVKLGRIPLEFGPIRGTLCTSCVSNGGCGAVLLIVCGGRTSRCLQMAGSNGFDQMKNPS